MALTRLGTNAITTVSNSAISLDAAEIPNLAASKITSGTFADARIASSNVSQHVTAFDDNKLVNDISTLALRQASNENKAAYNTNSMYVDVFQDSTGITALTNTARSSSEYINTSFLSSSTFDPQIKQIQQNSSVTTGTWTGAVSNGMANPPGGSDYSTYILNYGFPLNGNNFTANVYTVTNSTGNRDGNMDYPAQSIFVTTDTNYQGANPSAFFGTVKSTNLYGDLAPSSWANYMSSGAVTNTGISSSSEVSASSTNTISQNVGGGNYVARQYLNNSSGYWGYKWAFNASTNTLTGEYRNNGTSGFTGNGKITLTNLPATGTVFFAFGEANSGGKAWATNANGYTNQSSATTTGLNATGSFTSNNITASSSTSKMGAIITYQDYAGTNTLNTDIVLKLSADGGSNYATATLTAMPDFATGIKMAKVNDLSVTAGTSLKYKLEFANQSLGSKEARIRGVSLQY